MPLPTAADYPPPATPRTLRTLRKLQSAHNLGATYRPSSFSNPSASSFASIITGSLHHAPSQIIYPSPSSASVSSISSRDLHLRDNLRENTLRDLYGHTTQLTKVVGEAKSSESKGLQSSPLTRSGGSVRKKRAAYANVKMSLSSIIRDGPPDGDFEGTLETLRYKILEEGIKSDSDGMSSVRIYAWLVLLNAPPLLTDKYLSLIHRSASPAYSKIRNDTFRTLTTSPLFRRRVTEASLIRLLNATAWSLHDSLVKSRKERKSLGPPQVVDLDTDLGDHRSSPAAKNRARALTGEGGELVMEAEAGIYVQGMNVLAAPFLYVARSEAEAFRGFYTLLTKEIPGYTRGAMEGVHKGLTLVDKVLSIVDPPLSSFLLSKGLRAEIYAFPSVLTLCACTPPLTEVIKLWDFLLAYGMHLNILCIVAQLYGMREDILQADRPSNLLRNLPPLKAEEIKKLTISFVGRIPRSVYEEIVGHAK